MSCSAPIVNGVTPSGGGGSVPSGPAEVIWEFDWSAQSSFDFAVAGDGTYNIGGTPVTAVHMANAERWEIVPATGLEAVMPLATTFTQWTGTVPPTAPHVYITLGDILPASAFTSGRYWAFMWEVPTWSLPVNTNLLWAKGVNPVSTAETAFGRNAIWGGGFRRQVVGTGTPPTNYNGTVGGAGESTTRMPQVEGWHVLCVMVWGGLQNAAFLGGPLSAWGNPEQLMQIGNHNELGGAGDFAPGQTFVNPFGGRILWGLSRQTTTNSQPTATLRRQMIMRGAYG